MKHALDANDPMVRISAAKECMSKSERRSVRRENVPRAKIRDKSPLFTYIIPHLNSRFKIEFLDP